MASAGTALALDDDRAAAHRDSVLVRISQIIDAFDASAPVLSLGQLTVRTGMPKSTVYRLTEQLVELRWLERSLSGYRLGFKFFEIGGLVAMRNRLRTCAMPYLKDLQARVGESVHMAVLDGLDVVILAKIWGHGGSTPTWDGVRMPVHCTATGKVLLAHGEPHLADAAIARGLDRKTAVTIVNPSVFRQTLSTIRTKGYATESEEHVPGLCCAAAPVLDATGRAVAAVSVSGLVYRLDYPRTVPLLKRCAADIGAAVRRSGHR